MSNVACSVIKCKRNDYNGSTATGICVSETIFVDKDGSCKTKDTDYTEKK